MEFEPLPLDAAFVRRAFDDASVAVRVAMAQRIEWTVEPDDAITAIVMDRLAVEDHPAVRAALLQVQAALMGVGHRRRRSR